jgi:poly(A)-specific ribonuclease
MDASSIEFLNQHGMDFNKWTREGVPYVTVDVANALERKYETQQQEELQGEKSNNTSSNSMWRDPTRRRITLTKESDVQFHARAMASLREWIDRSIQGSPSMLLPACNRFLRRALYETIELEYPALILENAGSEYRDQIRVWRLSEEEKVQRKERLAREAWETLVMNVGFTRVFMALSNANKGFKQVNSTILASSVEQVDVSAKVEFEPMGRRVPIICHNGLMDILFLITHFVSHKLPEKYQDAKAMIHETFPLVYDTKILATECSDQRTVGDNTVLGTLFDRFVMNDLEFLMDRNFEVVNASGSDPDQKHEASYDAFMTGAVFVALARRIQEEEGLLAISLCDIFSSDYNLITKDLFGRNKVSNTVVAAYPVCGFLLICLTCCFVSASLNQQLFLMLTLYTIDLENATEDPLRRGLSPTSTYRVSGIDPAITTSDIIRCLSNLVDQVLEQQVRFEIVWVDDRTFLVAARTQDDDDTLQRHGELIHMALRRRFACEDICTLDQYLQATAAAEEAKQRTEESGGGMWSSFLALFGYGKNKRKSEEWDGMDGEPSAKRRRT